MKQADYIEYVTAKLSRTIKIFQNMHTDFL